ncbi:MAG TPA: glutathione binding-like protein [Dongiaceae bacterium]|nr:glutathione binding-like protein [Dongiaceae bacterium]
MSEIELHGPANSSFVCAARVALEEKGVVYHLIEPDILQSRGFRLGDLLRYLAAQQPKLVIDDFALYDCDSILRYIDEAYDGPALQPADAKTRALMVETQGIIRDYLHPAAIGKIATQRLFAPFLGGSTDMRLVEEAVTPVNDALNAIEQLSASAHDGEQAEMLLGARVSLADIALMPIAAYLTMTPEGQTAIAASRRLSRWWLSVSRRPSLARSWPGLG